MESSSADLQGLTLRTLRLDDYHKGCKSSACFTFRQLLTLTHLPLAFHSSQAAASDPGYLELLAQLTTVGDVSFANFEGEWPTTSVRREGLCYVLLLAVYQNSTFAAVDKLRAVS